MTQRTDYGILDGGTQYKIFDRSMARLTKLTGNDLECCALSSLYEIVQEETDRAVRENITPCQHCNHFLCWNCKTIQNDKPHKPLTQSS